MLRSVYLIVDPPLTPPPLSTPAGAERGANSRIWPRHLSQDVQGYGQRRRWGLNHANKKGQRVGQRERRGYTPVVWSLQGHGPLRQWEHAHGIQDVQRPDQCLCLGRTHACVRAASHNAQAPKIPQTARHSYRPQVSTAGTSSHKTHAQIRLLSPPFRPGGGGKGLGDRGGSTIKNPVLFHFEIIRVVVASPCRATALPSASRLDTNDLETEFVRRDCMTPSGISPQTNATNKRATNAY